jgi:hypothetical protein
MCWQSFLSPNPSPSRVPCAALGTRDREGSFIGNIDWNWGKVWNLFFFFFTLRIKSTQKAPLYLAF